MPANVLYTVWSDGCLVGETPLDYIANTSEVKFGDFKATRFGERLIAVCMLPRQAICARASLERIREYQARRDDVVLELRSPAGAPIPTDDIEITDLDWLMTLVPPETEDDWESDVEMAATELAEALDPPVPRCDPFDGLIPAELLAQELENLDVGDVCASEDTHESFDLKCESARYQIQVYISNGG